MQLVQHCYRQTAISGIWAHAEIWIIFSDQINESEQNINFYDTAPLIFFTAVNLFR